MSPGRLVGLVAAREIRERIRSRGFIIGTIVMLVLVVVIFALPALLLGPGDRIVGITGTAPPRLATAIESLSQQADLAVDTRAYSSVAAGEAALRDGDAEVLIVESRELIWASREDAGLRTVIETALYGLAVQDRSAELGLTPDQATSLLAPVTLDSRVLEVGGVQTEGRQMLALAVALLLLVTISTYGNYVLTGVVEEKASRVVEVLLARLESWQLLSGKIIGIGLLGLAQLVVLTVAISIARIVVGPAGFGGFEVPEISPGLLAGLIGWFVLGFAFYSVIYGALGALASRIEDAQNASGPATFTLIGVYLLSLTTIYDPETGLGRFLAIFPVSAPIALPIRIATGQSVWWEIALGIALMLITIVIAVRIAGRIYSGALLVTRGRVPLRHAWRVRTSAR